MSNFTLKEESTKWREFYNIPEEFDIVVFDTLPVNGETEKFEKKIFSEAIDKIFTEEYVTKKSYGDFNLTHHHLHYQNNKYHIVFVGYHDDDEVEVWYIAYIKGEQNVPHFKKDLFGGEKKISYPHGIYTVSQKYSGITLNKISSKYPEEPIFDSMMASELKNDIDIFFKSAKKFKQYNLPHKRGVLLYGPPGNGKTLFIKYLLDKYRKDSYGMIIEISENRDINLDDFKRLMNSPRFVKSKKIVVFEDVDGIPQHKRSEFLNFMDGIDIIENAFIIATTNYPHLVDYALTNRPSRFDSLFFIDAPSDKSRKKLLLKYFPYLKGNELSKYIDVTKGFSGAYFKELFILVKIIGKSLDEAVKAVQDRIEIVNKNYWKDSDKDEENYMG